VSKLVAKWKKLTKFAHPQFWVHVPKFSGVGGFEGSGGSERVCHQRMPRPPPPSLYEITLTGFLRFASTPLSSSVGCPDPWTPHPSQLCCCQSLASNCGYRGLSLTPYSPITESVYIKKSTRNFCGEGGRRQTDRATTAGSTHRHNRRHNRTCEALVTQHTTSSSN